MKMFWHVLFFTLCVEVLSGVQIPVWNPNPPPPPPYGFAVIPYNNTGYYQPNNTWNSTNGCKSNAINSTLSHHLFLGCVRNGDKLLFTQQYVKPGRWWSSREKIIEYPGALQQGLVPLTISGIRVFDNYYNGSGGYCSLLSGGVGYRHVRLRLYSKSAGKGINFTVKIYGN